MRVTRAAVTRTCAICERTLLMGERAVRFTPDGAEYVDVCPLCQEVAVEHGWMREGSPLTPTVPYEARRRRRTWGGLLGTAIVQDPGRFGCKRLFERAGRIPAPLQSYRN